MIRFRKRLARRPADPAACAYGIARQWNNRALPAFPVHSRRRLAGPVSRMHPRHDQPDRSRQPSRDQGRGRRRVIVDDHPDRASIQADDRRPSRTWRSVARATERRRAARIRELVPDIVIVDLALQEGDGLELVRDARPPPRRADAGAVDARRDDLRAPTRRGHPGYHEAGRRRPALNALRRCCAASATSASSSPRPRTLSDDGRRPIHRSGQGPPTANCRC